MSDHESLATVVYMVVDRRCPEKVTGPYKDDPVPTSFVPGAGYHLVIEAFGGRESGRLQHKNLVRLVGENCNCSMLSRLLEAEQKKVQVLCANGCMVPSPMSLLGAMHDTEFLITFQCTLKEASCCCRGWKFGIAPA
ncbi:unnamed protein product [Ilex paraguariensis]|uniref:Uncharacterized protein n=1 Tax=Ilex paraguariensis TaxID=185542 RepID=A0ABC8R4U4_9AQUA